MPKKLSRISCLDVPYSKSYQKFSYIMRLVERLLRSLYPFIIVPDANPLCEKNSSFNPRRFSSHKSEKCKTCKNILDEGLNDVMSWTNY